MAGLVVGRDGDVDEFQRSVGVAERDDPAPHQSLLLHLGEAGVTYGILT